MTKAAQRVKLSHAENSIPSLEGKLLWLQVTIGGTLLCCMGLSWRLWTSSRLFPLIPIGDFLPPIPSLLAFVCFVVMIAFLVAAIVRPQSRGFVVAFLIACGLLCLWDQNRWQPWLYQCFCLLLLLAIYATKKPGLALNGARLIVIATYFWSGLQKLNSNFIHETWPDMAGPLLRHIPYASRTPAWLLLVIPLTEIGIAVALTTRKFRSLAVWLAIATHAIILITMIVSRENVVVWPWNLAMILFVLILFRHDRETSLRQIFAPSAGQLLILLFFGILPALSFAGLWDSYLSSALYSGNTEQAVVYVSPAVIERLPASIRPHIWQNSQPFFLDVNRWSYGDLNVPLYPEPRVYRRVTEDICRYAAGDSHDVRLRIKQRPNLLTGIRKSDYYDCDHLDGQE